MTPAPGLFVSAYAPTLGTGRALRTYTVVRALAHLGPLDLLYVARGDEGPCPEYRAIPGVAFHELRASRGLRRAMLYARERLLLTPAAWARGMSPELVDAATAMATAPGRGRVVVGDMHSATALLPLAGSRPIVYNAHNLESSYHHAGHAARAWSRWSIARFERRLLRAAAESWMVSRRDMAMAYAMVPDARLRYVPNVVDVSAIRPTPRPGTRTALFIADFNYHPNRTALTYLLERVMPEAWSELPEARLHVVGRGLDDWDPPDPRVKAMGFISDVGDAYAGADVVVVPLLEGGGSPLKFVEALAYAMPVVATPRAAAGLEVQRGEHYREAADAAAFAGELVEILRTGAPDLAARARGLAEREYSIERLQALLAEP